MPNSIDVYDPDRIVNRVDDAMVAHSDPPEIRSPLELDASGTPRIQTQGLDA